jgi:hypothetical protein
MKKNKESFFDKLTKKAKSNKIIAVLLIIFIVFVALLGAGNGILDFYTKINPDEVTIEKSIENKIINIIDTENKQDIKLYKSCRLHTCINFFIPEGWIKKYDHTVVMDDIKFIDPLNSLNTIRCQSTIECPDLNLEGKNCDTFICNSICWDSHIKKLLQSTLNDLKILNSIEVETNIKFDDEFSSDPYSQYGATRLQIEFTQNKTLMKGLVLSHYFLGSGHTIMFMYPKHLSSKMDSLASRVIDNVCFNKYGDKECF